jgi:hypothetical protein
MGIRERIIASPDLQAARAARNLDALAAGLNAQGVTAIQSRFVTLRTIEVECADGDNIVSALAGASTTNALVGMFMSFLKQDSGLDIGLAKTISAINSLSSGLSPVLTATQAAQLKNMAMRPVIVTRLEVEAAMYNLDGSEKSA